MRRLYIASADRASTPMVHACTHTAQCTHTSCTDAHYAHATDSIPYILLLGEHIHLDACYRSAVAPLYNSVLHGSACAHADGLHGIEWAD